MWGGTDVQTSINAIKAAYDHGVTSIDTAPIYGMGTSEEIVGEAVNDLPRDKVQILTKYGLRWEGTNGEFYFKSKMNDGSEVDLYKYAAKESVLKECEDSLRRLKTDYIDLYQIHWFDSTTPIEETMEAVQQLMAQGKIRYAGVCNYKVEWIKTAETTVPLASNQVPYSMLNRNIETDVVPYCLSQKKAIIAYSPMERGLLTGKIRPGQKFGEGDHRASHKFFTPENVKRVNAFLEALKPLAESKHATLGQLVLRWTIEQPGITIALAGARNAEQAVQNACAADVTLTSDEIIFINNELTKVTLN